MLPTAILGKLRETGIPQTIGGFSMQVYADNAATTKMSQTSIDAMLPYMTTVYGNPSSLHSVGQRAKEALDAARETVAQCLGCRAPGDHFHQSGGSEADNQAIISAAPPWERRRARSTLSPPLLSTTPCCTPCKKLEKEGFDSRAVWMSTRTALSPPEQVEAAITAGYLPGDHHVRQQRDRHHPAHCRRSAPSARRHGVPVPHRCRSGCGSPCPST